MVKEMSKKRDDVVLWTVAIGDRADDAIKLAKKTVDTAMVVEYTNARRLSTDAEIKASGMEACTQLRDRLAALNTNAKTPLTVHLHYCGPYTMGIYLGMLSVLYKIPVVSLSSYDRQTRDSVVVTVGGSTEATATAAATTTLADGDKTW